MCIGGRVSEMGVRTKGSNAALEACATREGRGGGAMSTHCAESPTTLTPQTIPTSTRTATGASAVCPATREQAKDIELMAAHVRHRP